MICVDSSVAAKWLFEEEYSDRADALLVRTLNAGEPIVIPPLLLSEVTNIIRQRMLADQLPLADASQKLAQLLALPFLVHTPEELYTEALMLADRFNLPATYDAHYLALARMQAAILWTDDRKLLHALADQLSFVSWIGDYPV